VDDPSQGERAKPAVLQLDLPGPARAAAPPAPLRRSSRIGARRGIGRGVAVAGLLTLAALGAGALLLPGYVRRACVEQAAAHGIALAIDSVGIGHGGFVLTGVKATSSQLPGMSVEAPEVDIETLDLRPEKITAAGMEIAVDGRWSAVSAALAGWRASPRGGQGGAWAPASLVIDGSRVVWRGPIGDDARVEAAGVHLDVTWRDAQPTVHATSSHVIVAVPGATLGPWRFDLDRDPGASRLRVALDPGVPDACTVLIVGNGETVTAVDVSVPRSPVARLGIAPALLGLRGDIQLAAAVHYSPFGAPPFGAPPAGAPPFGAPPSAGSPSGAQTSANAIAKGGLYGLSVSGVPRPIDISWDATARGDRAGAGNPAGGASALDVQDARIAVGPLVGSAHGTLKTFDDGFRLDLAWRAGPVPCAAFDAPLGPGEPFDIAYELRKLAESTGLARVHGDVTANATLAFDSRDLGSTAVHFVPTTNCDVALGF
jgi:hypothetical protein